MNMIIGKRQIILAALVMGLGIAVYLNWEYSRAEIPVIEAEEHVPNYGEAHYVDAPASGDIPGDEEIYFVQAKISRQRARDEAVETLATMLADANLDTTQRTQLALRAADLAESIETEGKIENLIKAKGFTDVMVYYDTQRADVIVRTSGLLAQEAAQIKDIILKETDIEPEKISIVEIN
jgi:stage III sporulation protein AH